MFNIEDKRMSFTEHLGELRVRLIRICVTLIVTFFAGWAISGSIVKLLQYPIDTGTERYNDWVEASAPKDIDGNPIVDESKKSHVEWQILSPQESFVVQLRLAMYFAVLCSFPVLVFQVCAFIFPGLTPKERGVVLTILGGSSVLAVGGTITGYFGVLPFVMPYLLNYVPEGIAINLQLSTTISFILILIAGFGVAFQFPMFVLAAVFLDLVSVQTLTQYRRVAIVIIAVVSAILTPPDPISMSIMMLPLVLLYETSILVARVVTWRRAKNNTTTDITPV